MPFEDIAEAFGQVLGDRLAEVHTVVIGEVRRYDAGAQVCDIQPVVTFAVARAEALDEGEALFEQLPLCRSVPVAFLRSDPWVIAFPLAVGKPAIVLVADRDFGTWRRSGRLSDPEDRALHHLSHSIALSLSIAPRSQALSADHADRMVIGQDGSSPRIELTAAGQAIIDSPDIRAGSSAATSKVALEPNLQQHLTAISQGLDAVSLAALGVVDPNYGVAAKAVLDAAFPIAATKLRAE